MENSEKVFPDGGQTENKKLKIKDKIGKFFYNLPDFIKAHYGYFVIPLFVLVVFGVALSNFDIWPFGTAIIASYDMLAQVCPIIEHFFDVFSGESGLFHTFRLGGGMDMFGILAFCSISPFTFLFLLAGQGGTVYMVSIVLPLKVICIGLSAFIFLRVYFKTLPQYAQMLLALLYAYSGYVYVANTYIIWMDLMIYMPVLGAGIIEFSKKKSIKLLVIGLALNVYTCFSITCFSFFTLFPVLVCYVLICKEKEEWREYLSKLSLAFVVAVGVSLPVLIPSLLAYLQAGRNTGLFSRVFEIMSESKVKEGELNLHIYEKFSYILCDSTFIALMVVYFFRSKKGDKLSIFLLVALIYLLIPCLVDESMLLLNMGSYYSYALRFGFLLEFYFLFVSAKAIEEFIADNADQLEGVPQTERVEQSSAEKGETVESAQRVEKAEMQSADGEKPPKLPLKTSISMAVVAVLTVVGVLFTLAFFNYILDGKYENDPLIAKIFGSDTELTPFKDFFPLFAHSEGGLEGIAVLFVVVSVIFIITAVLIKLKCVKLKDVACFLCILSLSQTVFFNFALVKGDRQSTSAQKFDYYKEMIEEVGDDEYYRLKNYDYYISSDSPLILQNYSHTLFSSMADAKNITQAKFYKYRGSLTNSTRSNGGSAFSDALIGYKYVVFEAGDLSSAKKDYYSFTGVVGHKIPSIKVSYTYPYKTTEKTSTKIWENIDRDLHGKNKWSSLKIVLDGKTFKGYLEGKLIYSLEMQSSNITKISAPLKDVYGSIKNLKVYGKNGNLLNGGWAMPDTWSVTDGVYSNTTVSDEAKKKFASDSGELFFEGSLDGIGEITADVSFEQGTGADDHIGIAVTVDENYTYRLVIEPNAGYFVYENELSFPLASVIKNGELNFEGLEYDEQYRLVLTLLNDGEEVISSGTSISTTQIRKLKNKLEQKEVKYTLVKNGIKFDKFTAEKGEMLYLNYVNLKGYKAYVNGVEREIKDNGLDLFLIELDEGENVVEIKYKSPYISFILIGIALACLIFAICYVCYKVKPVVFEKVSVVLPWAAVILAFVLTVFFFVFPTGVYFHKFFGTYIKFLA